MIELFQDFLTSKDTLRVYECRNLLFASEKDGLAPLLEYSRLFPRREIVVFDRIAGNAAALLAVRAGCRELYSPLGSQLAVATLQRHGVKYHLSEIVPFIQKVGEQAMCPMEKLSLGKEPEEFYHAVISIFGKRGS